MANRYLNKKVTLAVDGRDVTGKIEKYFKTKNFFLISFELNGEKDTTVASYDEVKFAIENNTPIVA